MKYLEQFPEFITFRELRHEPQNETAFPVAVSADVTPEETLDAAYGRLRLDLEGELLEQVKSASPSFFERLVVELLVRMGYGGMLRDAGQAVGKSGDGGIDGIIKEDRLGLDVIYDGILQLVARRSRSLRGLFRDIELVREYSSQLHRSLPTLLSLRRGSTARLCSLTDLCSQNT